MEMEHADPDGREFFAQVATYLTLEDREKVRQAFELARREHGDDRRKSGELFFTHPLTVASYLAEYYVDASALVAALLHDVAEDTSVSIREIEDRFGQEVGRIVDGVTKFDRVTAKAKLGRELSADEVRSATLYNLFQMMTNDVRVGIVKIFDRLHNMRTIKAMPIHKQREKARETLSVYAPLARRLGMWLIKNELQELSLEIVRPLQYQMLKERLKIRDERHELDFKNLKQELSVILTQVGIPPIDIQPAPDDIYGVAQQMTNTADGGDGRILDAPPRIVVLLRDINACYLALGNIHARWRPIQGEFDDYIAAPRDNLYRSLHTTVIYNGRPVKIRIRTLNMQIESQSGVLAQWMNNTNMPVWSPDAARRVNAMINTISEKIAADETEITESVRTVLDDVFSNQIIVYTPNGDMIELPQGATPVDFAYKIHTEVGHSCRGARVNGEQMPLTYVLQDGDNVHIEQYGHEPQRVWLDENLGYLHTTGAKASVRRWFRKLPNDKVMVQGRKLLNEELSLLCTPDYSHEQVAEWFGMETAEELYHGLGRAELLPTAVGTKILTDMWANDEPLTTVGRSVESAHGEHFVIENAGNRPLRLCGTCTPRPGDPLVGFIRQDGYVTVHATACRTLSPDAMRGGRALKLRWGEEGQERGRPIIMQIEVHDRDGLLNDITELMSSEQINITTICSRTVDYRATIVLGLEMSSPRQVVRFLHQVQALVNVIFARYIGYAPREWVEGRPTPKGTTCSFDLLRNGECSLH